MGNLTIGYETNKLINFELNLLYLYGKPVSYANSIFYSNGTETMTKGLFARSILLTPSIILVKEIKNYCPYISIGLTVGFTSVKNVSDYSIDIIQRKEHIEGTYKSNPSVGITTKIGIMKRVNDRVGIFGDVSITNITFSPNKHEITKYTINGSDSLSTLNVSQIKTEYNDDYSIKYKYENGQWVESWNKNAPRKLKKFDIPASFIAINLGVRFYFIKLKKEIPKE